MSEILSIGVGGFVGSVTRYLMSAGVSAVLGRDFPYGTFAVNALLSRHGTLVCTIFGSAQ